MFPLVKPARKSTFSFTITQHFRIFSKKNSPAITAKSQANCEKILKNTLNFRKIKIKVVILRHILVKDMFMTANYRIIGK